MQGNWKLYKIVNVQSGKEYVGITTRSLNTRLIEHLSRLKKNYHPSVKMKIDYDLYGKKSFTIELIKESDFDCISQMEKELTRRTVVDGYNTIIGGFDSEERGNSSRVYQQKLKDNPELMEKRRSDLSFWNKGKVMSEEAKFKMSQAKKGKKWKIEHVEKRSKQYTGQGNPNAGKFAIYLNNKTGIFYETPDLLKLLGISKSCLIKYNRSKNDKVSDFLKV